jgi:hypothetical protein
MGEQVIGVLVSRWGFFSLSYCRYGTSGKVIYTTNMLNRFSTIAAHLNAFLGKGTPPQKGPIPSEYIAAFNQLRDKLLHPPVLDLPRTKGAIWLDADASDGLLGCCLLQEQPDGKPLPLGYWSRTLNTAERNYSSTEKKCLAIVWAVNHLRHYL